MLTNSLMCDIYIFLPYIEKLKMSRDVLLSNYLMTKYGSVHSLEVLNGGHDEGTIEDYPAVHVLGWRVVTTMSKPQ